MDTDMAAGIDEPETDPAVVAELALDAVAAGDYEVLAGLRDRLVACSTR